MMSRVLRRLQEGKSGLEDGICDSEENYSSTVRAGARRKNVPANPFAVLIKHSQSESDELEDKDEVQSQTSVYSQENGNDANNKRKKKKKRKKAGRDRNPHDADSQEAEIDILDSEDRAPNIENNANQIKTVSASSSTEDSKNLAEHFSELINIKLKNLNVNNELKKMFGSKVIGSENRQRNRGRMQIKSFWLVSPKETWPTLSKTGLSMRLEKSNGKFVYVHNPDYQRMQRRFLRAVNSFNQENIAAIVYSCPYHVDALIQLSDLYKLTEDLQTAADLNERALYSLESAFHPMFNMARGTCQLDYRQQENRALFICLFKHLTFVGQRACYNTALELCKLLLSFDFELDPLAVILCIDFYALRSRNYQWLIDASQKWERKKNLSQLPNFAFSTALAHFYLEEKKESGNFTQADKLLQDALILFPGVLNLLLEKCSIQKDDIASKHHFFNTDLELTQSRALIQLITLYVHRTYCEWKTPNVIRWLEKNVHVVLQRVDSGEMFVKDCLLQRLRNYCSTPRNVLRHIILSDIKEVTATIAAHITSPILSFDPVPPLDSVDLYSYEEFSKYNEESRSLTTLFFASLLPNFQLNNRHQNGMAVARGVEADDLLEPRNEQVDADLRDVRRDGVMMLLDAIGAIVARLPLHNRTGGEDGNENEEHLLLEIDGEEREAAEPP